MRIIAGMYPDISEHLLHTTVQFRKLRNQRKNVISRNSRCSMSERCK